MSGEFEFGRWVAALNDGSLLQSVDGALTWTPVQSFPGYNFSGIATDTHQAWVAVAWGGAAVHSHDRAAHRVRTALAPHHSRQRIPGTSHSLRS